MRDWKWWLVPGVTGIVFLLQWARNLTPFFATITLSFDGDVAMHVLLGDLMLEQGGWLATEPTSIHVPDKTFIAHEWLAEVLFALASGAFGLGGPLLLVTTLLAVLSSMLVRRMLAAGAGVWPAVFTLIAALMVQNTHLLARPHVASWLFSFLFATWAARARAGELTLGGWVARVVPLMLVWVQFHAGFLIVLPILLAFVAAALVDVFDEAGPDVGAKRLRETLVVGVVAIGVSGLNPWGFRLHEHFLSWLANDYMMGFTSEFKPPDFRMLSGRFLLAFFVLGWLGLALQRRRPDSAELFLWFGMTIMALSSARYGPLFATVCAPFVARWLEDGLRGAQDEPTLLGRLCREVVASSARLVENEPKLGGWGTIGAVVVGSVLAIGSGRLVYTFDDRLQPVKAMDFVEAHPAWFDDRQMFNTFRWGGYIAWRLHPEHKVAINSWHDHLGQEVISTYLKVHNTDPGWQDVLVEQQVDWIVYPTGDGLQEALDRDATWKLVFRDHVASVWLRADLAVDVPEASKTPAPLPGG